MSGIEYKKFASVYDILMSDVNYDAWADYVDGILSAHSVETCVDCGCGTGALTIRLQKHGYKLTGIDISEDMLRVAADNARNAGECIPFICMDMKKLVLHKAQDAVISACDGVNYLCSIPELTAFFSAAYKSVKVGGVITFDISTRHKLEHVLDCNTYAEDDGSHCAYIWKNMYDPQSKLIEMELSLFVNGKCGYERSFEKHIQRAHSTDEITNVLYSCGFDDICAYDFLTNSPCCETSERIQFCAVRRQKG